MIKDIRQYRPGQTITLYDAHIDSYFFGVMYLSGQTLPLSSQLLTPKSNSLPILSNLIATLKGLFSGSRAPSFTFSKGMEKVNTEQLNTYANHFFKMAAITCLAISLVYIFFITWPLIYSQGVYTLNQLTEKKPAPSLKPQLPVYSGSYVLSEDLGFLSNEFKIAIPKLDLISDVIADVDPSVQDIYAEKLKQGVAHAKGSYYPGENGPVYLFSHSTDSFINIQLFNAKFFGLKDLSVGDEIILHYKGSKYKYYIHKKQIINPKEVDLIKESDSPLILSTCWPPGTDWQRLVIFADTKPPAKEIQ